MGDIDIRFYLSILLKRLPFFLLIAISILSVGVAAAFFMPPVYRASAKILVEAPQIPTDLARSTVSTSAVEQMQVLQQQITTRAYLLELADRLHVYDTKSKLSSADIVENMRSRIGFEQVEMEGSSSGPGATVFNVSFDAREPVLAANVVNDLVDFVLGQNKSLRADRAGETQKFFEQEVARLGAELNALEAKILKFKNENKDALPDSLDFRRNEQSRQQERLLLLEREESGLRSRRNNLVETYESTGRIVGTGPLTPEQQQLQDLNRNLSEQLTIFSDGSPTIVALRARIAALRNEQAKADAIASKGAKGGSSELAMQLSDIDDRLQFIVQEKAYITGNLADLQKSIAATPGNESVLLALQRNHANFQTQYNTAVANLAQASTGEQIEVNSKGSRFSLVEPADAPNAPISPKRRLIAAGGLAAGVGGGIGFILLLELLNKTVRRPEEFVQQLKMHPLVTVPYVWIEGEWRAEAKKLAVLSGLAATLMPVLLLAVHYYYMPIGSVLEKLVTTLDHNRMM
jgi:polysaccharide biosynthesis transport protein